MPEDRDPNQHHQEYERAVMFRLGLLLSGGARGPGVFFIIPCVDIVEIVDMRVQVFNVPPQEVRLSNWSTITQQSPRPRS